MDFFGVGPLEIVLVLIIALLVFGPHKIPEVGRALGKTARVVRKATSDWTAEVTREVESAEKSSPRPEEESPLSPEEEVKGQQRRGE